jgi:hypothetical protein
VLWKLKDMDMDLLWPIASFKLVPDVDAAKEGLRFSQTKRGLLEVYSGTEVFRFS